MDTTFLFRVSSCVPETWSTLVSTGTEEALAQIPDETGSKGSLTKQGLHLLPLLLSDANTRLREGVMDDLADQGVCLQSSDHLKLHVVYLDIN